MLSIRIIKGFCGGQMGSGLVKPAKKETGHTQSKVSFNQQIRALLAVSQRKEIFGQAARIGEVPSDQIN